MTFEADGPTRRRRSTTYVANTHLHGGLLGPRDEHLRVVERAFPAVARSASRATGSRSRAPTRRKVLRLFDELVLVLESGQSLDAAKIARTIDMVDDDLRPSEVLRHEVVRGAKGKPVRPSTAGQKRYTDAIDVVHDHLRHRAGRHRQELPRGRRRRSRRCTGARSSASC